VNGKVRGRVVLAKDADEKAALAAALTDKGVQTQTAGKQIVKTVYVPGRVLNLIVK
jgi:leucyl-tRNA synthetase